MHGMPVLNYKLTTLADVQIIVEVLYSELMIKISSQKGQPKKKKPRLLPSLDDHDLHTVAQKGHPSLHLFKITFCKLVVFQFCTFVNMQFINQALLQTCCLSICIQYIPQQ